MTGASSPPRERGSSLLSLAGEVLAEGRLNLDWQCAAAPGERPSASDPAQEVLR
jgi:hypothetical protein